VRVCTGSVQTSLTVAEREPPALTFGCAQRAIESVRGWRRDAALSRRKPASSPHSDYVLEFVDSLDCGRVLPEPMLARAARLPTSGDFAYEAKWDGFRVVVSTEGPLRVRSRRGGWLLSYSHWRTPPTPATARTSSPFARYSRAYWPAQSFSCKTISVHE
jgi:hypothetical protein